MKTLAVLFSVLFSFSMIVSTAQAQKISNSDLSDIFDGLDQKIEKQEMTKEEVYQLVVTSIDDIESVDTKQQIKVFVAAGLDVKVDHEVMVAAHSYFKQAMIQVLNEMQVGLTAMGQQAIQELDEIETLEQFFVYATASRERLKSLAADILAEKGYDEESSEMFPALIIHQIKLDAFMDIPSLVAGLEAHPADTEAWKEASDSQAHGILMLGSISLPIILGEDMIELEKAMVDKLEDTVK